MSRISWAYSGSSSMVPHRGCRLAEMRWRCPSTTSCRCLASQAFCRDVEGRHRTTSGDRGCLWGMSGGNQCQGSPCRVVLHRQQGSHFGQECKALRTSCCCVVQAILSCTGVILHQKILNTKQSGPAEITAVPFSPQHEQGRLQEREP